MKKTDDIAHLKEKILRLEIENKHLTNELLLAEEEKETARNNYYDIIRHMEEKVAQRTQESSELRLIAEAKNSELQIMLDWSHAMIFYKDIQHRYIRVNAEFSKTLGIPINKIIGRTYRELFPGGDTFLEDDLEVMTKGEPVLNSSGVIETAMGTRNVLANKIPYKDLNGKIIGIIGFAFDITEQKKAEKEKKNLEDKLVQLEKMEAIGRLASGVAHDLNNVLSAVVSYPDLLLTRLEPDSPMRKPIETIQKSGKKAAAIVEDLLTLARRGVSVTQVVQLNDIIRTYLESPEYEVLLSYNRKVKFIIQLADDLLNIKGSPIHLTKMIMNLVANAAEAVLHQGTVTITTANRYIDKPINSYDLYIPEGDYAVFTIADTGIGIPQDNLKRIFEPFYTKKVMGRSGTGLGMAVVWGTVKDHKGNINIVSVEGEGTVFEIYLPITREMLPKQRESISRKLYAGNNERILVVDDVLEQREISSMLLQELSYFVFTVSSGEEAIAFLRKNSVDLVILDMIMDPGIDGLDTYKRIIQIHPGQPAIITSGYSETDRVSEALQLGVGQYIKKPYTMETIGLAVRHELSKIKNPSKTPEPSKK